MFDVGFAELLLLSVVGLLVLGPERLPRVARTLGGFARKARSSWTSLKRTIEAEINASELKEPLQRFGDEFKSTVDSVKTGVDKLNEPLKDLDPLVSDSNDKPDEPNDAA